MSIREMLEKHLLDDDDIESALVGVKAEILKGLPKKISEKDYAKLITASVQGENYIRGFNAGIDEVIKSVEDVFK